MKQTSPTTLKRKKRLDEIVKERMDFHMWRIRQYRTIKNVPNLPGIIDGVVERVAKETAIEWKKQRKE